MENAFGTDGVYLRSAETEPEKVEMETVTLDKDAPLLFLPG